MCDHKNLKCTNNVFSCLDCGAVLPVHYPESKTIDLPRIDEAKLVEQLKPTKRGKKNKAD